MIRTKTIIDGLVKSQFFTRRHKEHEENLLRMKGFYLCDFVAFCDISLFNNVSIILSLLFVTLIAGCSKEPRGTQPTIKVGEAAPAFTLELIDGKTVTLDAFKGKPLVIINMASWCPCSHDSAPVFKDAYETYHPKGVEFLMLGIQDSRSKFEKFVKKKGFIFQAGFDKGDLISKTYGVSAPPTTFFINSEGKVVSAFYGKITDREQLSAWIDEIVPKEAKK